MDKPNVPTLSLHSVRDILTLRYNKEVKPSLPKLTPDDFTETVSELSTDSVKTILQESLQSSVKNDCNGISIALSNGVDSVLILALLRETFPDLHISAISVKFTDSVDETQQASQTAKHFGADHEVIYLKNYLTELPKAISIIKQPFWDIHWYHIVKKAKTNGDYLLSGDGGDELFGGYTFRYKKFLSSVGTDSSPTARVKAYLLCHERDWVEDQEDVFGKKIGFSWAQIYEKLMPYFDNGLPLIQQVYLADYNGKLLYNFSQVSSALSKHFGIRHVAPLLSEKIISCMPHLKSSLKYDAKNNVGKLPLRRLLANYVDGNDDVLHNPTKQGFSVDTINLWRNFGYRLCEKYLSDARIVDKCWINPLWIEKNLKRKQDVKYVNKFLGLLAFEIWCRIFITSEMKADTLLEI